MRKFLLIFLFCFLIEFISYAASNSSYTFVPGKGITGLVYIENTLEAAVSVMGKSATSYEAKKSTHYVFPKYRLELLVRGGVVEGIIIKSPYYASQEGIKVGSTLDNVVSAYGSVYSTLSGDSSAAKNIFYIEKGIAFDIVNNKVVKIYLVKANTPFNY